MANFELTWSLPDGSATVVAPGTHVGLIFDDGAGQLQADVSAVLPEDFPVAAIPTALSRTASFAEIMGTTHSIFELLESEEFTELTPASVTVIARGTGLPLATALLRIRPESLNALVALEPEEADFSADPMLASLDSTTGLGAPELTPRPVLTVTRTGTAPSIAWLSEHPGLAAPTAAKLADVRNFLTQFFTDQEQR